MKQTTSSFDKFKELEPEFGSESEYINHLSQQLEALAKKHRTSIPELINKAENATEVDEDLSRALSVSSEITALKRTA